MLQLVWPVVGGRALMMMYAFCQYLRYNNEKLHSVGIAKVKATWSHKAHMHTNRIQTKIVTDSQWRH